MSQEVNSQFSAFSPPTMNLPDNSYSDAEDGETQRDLAKDESVPMNTDNTEDEDSVEEEDGDDPEVWGFMVSADPNLQTVKLRNKNGNGGDVHGTGAGYIFGRHEECDVTIPIPQVSNRHCLIFKEVIYNDSTNLHEECVLIEDMSTNGTYINGKRIRRGEQVRLHHGDQIQFAVYNQAKNMEFFDDRFYIFKLPERMRRQRGSEKSIHDEYIFADELGSGNFATVKLARHKLTGEQYAIKMLDKKRFNLKPKFVQNLRQEIALLMALNHESIIKIYGVHDEADTVYIVLELVRGGELFDAIIAHRKFSDEVTRQIMWQLFRALKYLHDRGISHRDLKPENILMVSKEPNDWRIKISDFGLAKFAGHTDFMQTLCGTPNYVAPEVLKHASGRQYTKAVDLWSCGVILYICLCGFPPFSDEMAPPSMTEQIKQGLYTFPQPFWDPVKQASAIDLIQKLLQVDPEKRLTVDQALDHPWMKAGNFGKRSTTFALGDTFLWNNLPSQPVADPVPTPEIDLPTRATTPEVDSPAPPKSTATPNAKAAGTPSGRGRRRTTTGSKRKTRDATPPMEEKRTTPPLAALQSEEKTPRRSPRTKKPRKLDD